MTYNIIKNHTYKHAALRLLLLLQLMMAGVTEALGAGYTITLTDSYTITGYGDYDKTYYNFQTNTPAVLPTEGDLRYRANDGSNWGLHNFGSGNRSAVVNIPVKEGDLLVIQQYNNADQTTINRGTKNETLSTQTNFLCFDISETADNITFTIPRYGGVVAALVFSNRYKYTIFASDGTNTIATIVVGSVLKNTAASYYYPQYLLHNGTLYEKAKQNQNPYYGQTTALITSDNYTETLIYTSSGINDVCYFSEGENMIGAGVVPWTGDNAAIRCSMGKGAYFTLSTNIVNLAVGKYYICGQVWGNSGTTFSVYEGSNLVWSQTTTGSLTTSSVQSFTLQNPATLNIPAVGNGGNKRVLDWLYIQKVRGWAVDDNAATVYLTDVDLDNMVDLPVFSKIGDEAVTYKMKAAADDNYPTTTIAYPMRLTATGDFKIQATANSTDYEYTLHVVSDEGGGTYNDATKTYTFDRIGTLASHFSVSSVPHITMALGEGDGTPTSIVVDDEDVGPVLKAIDGNGYSHPNIDYGRGGNLIPATGVNGGTYYVFHPDQKGTLTIWGKLSNACLYKYDGTTATPIVTNQNGTELQVQLDALSAGTNYYLYNGKVNNANNSTPLLHAFRYTTASEYSIDFSKMNFTPNTNGNSRRCDRTLPGFTMEFLGGDNAKCESNTSGGISNAGVGEIHFRNNPGGGLRFTPRLLNRYGTKVKITGITLGVSAANGSTTLHFSDGTTGTVSSSGDSFFAVNATENGEAYFTVDADASNHFYVTNVTLHYVAADGGDPDALLNMTKASPRLIIAKGIINTFSGDASEGDVAVTVSTPYYNKETEAYAGVNGTYYAWGYTGAPTNLTLTTDPSGVAIVTYRDDNATITNPHQPVVHYETVQNGQTNVTVTIAGNDYFEAASAVFTIINPTELSIGQSETITDIEQGQVVEVWVATHDGTAANISLTNTVDATLTGTASLETQVLKTYANASGDITVTNNSSSSVGIVGHRNYFKTATFEYTYPQDFTYAGFSVGPPIWTVTDNEGNDVTDKFHQVNGGLSSWDYIEAADGVTGLLTARTEIESPNNQTTASVTIELLPDTYCGFPTNSLYSQTVSDVLRVIPYPWTWHFDYGFSDVTDWPFTNNRTEYYNGQAAPVTYSGGTELSTTQGLLFEGGFRIYKNVGMYYAVYQGSAIHIPVKRGQLVTFNAAMSVGTRAVTVSNGMDDYGNDVTSISITRHTGGYNSYSVVAKEDGYLILHNTSNSDLYVKWIQVGKNPLKFKDGTSVVASTNTSLVNNYVINIWDRVQGLNNSYVTYSVVSSVNEGGTSEIIYRSFNTSTGEFTNGFTKNGTIVVRATYNNPDLVHEATAEYTLHITDYHFDHSPHQVLVNDNGRFSFDYQPYDSEGNKLTKPNPLNDESEVPEFSYEIVSNPFNNLRVEFGQETGLVDFSISGSGTGTIRIKAKAHYLEATFDLVITGPTFANSSPSIPQSTGQLLGNTALNMTDVTYYIDEMSVGILTADINSSTGDITNITGNGIIRVKATGTYEGNAKTIYAYVTVADEATEGHDIVWNFYNDHLHLYNSTSSNTNNVGSELNLPSDVAGYLATPVASRPSYSLIKNGTFAATYRSRTNNVESDPVCAYVAEMNGQNGYLMMETIGLQIYSASKALGVQTGDRNQRFVGLKTGSKLVIPKVKPGQYIQILWQRHSPGNGEFLKVKNLNDLNGNRITTNLHIGRCNYMVDDLVDPVTYDWQGTYTFQVATDEDNPSAEYVDAEFEVIIKGWVDFFQIRIYEGEYRETMNTYLRQLEDGVSVDRMPQIAATRELHERDIPVIRDYHAGNYMYGPSAPCKFRIECLNGTLDETTTVSSETWYSATNTPWAHPRLTIGNGWGKIKLIYEPLSQDGVYVINRKEYFITVGQKPHQQYPYTWDFTNVAGGALALDNDNAYQLIRDDDINWTPSGSNYAMKTDEASNYVPGALFVSSTHELKEHDGLGVMTGGLTQKVITSGGGARSTRAALSTENYMYCSTETTLTIPDLNENGQDWIYISSSAAPTTVTNATLVSTGDDGPDANSTNSVFKYKVANSELSNVTFAAGTYIYQIGVTHILKEISKVGNSAWATESRNHSIDHTLTGYFTANDVNAYTVTALSYANNKATTTVRMNAIAEDGFVPEETGLVLKLNALTDFDKTNGYNAVGGTGNIPLFYPAITTEQTSTSIAFPNNNLMRDNLTSRTFITECENVDGTDNVSGAYTRFILAKRYMTWKKENGTVVNPTGFESKEAAVFYRLHLYGGTQQVENSSLKLKDENGNDISEDSAEELNTLGPNKAYLLLETSKINPAIWTSGSPSRPYIAILGVSDMDEDFGGQSADEFPPTDRTYNLKGQPVNGNGHLRQGLYIRNGRKIVVKK